MIRRLSRRTCLLLGAAMAATGCSRQVNIVKCWSNDPDARIAGCTALIQTGGYATNSLAVIYNNRGNAYDRKKDYNLAIQDFNQAIRLNQSFAAGYLGRGVTYYHKGDYDNAILDLNELISLNPVDTSSNRYHGLTPNKTTAYFFLGSAYLNRGFAYDKKDDYGHAIRDYSDAIQGYDQAIRLNSNYAIAYYDRGFAYDSRGIEDNNSDDYDRSIQDYSEAIRLSPKDESIYRYRGLTYNQKSEYDLAIRDFNEAIRLNPKDTEAYIDRGVSYIREGDYDRAIQDVNEAIRLNPKYIAAYEIRGETYFFQSNLPAAISDFENAISGAPSSRTAVFTALMLHVAMKRQGRDDSHQLSQAAAANDLSKWPGPVLKLDMGTTTAGAVMAASANPSDARRVWHVCQANYFIAEDALFHNQRATALVRLKAARDGCPKFDIHSTLAQAELKRLGAPAQ